MADSWQKYLYEKRAAFAVDPLKSETSVQLLDVMVKTSRRARVLSFRILVPCSTWAPKNPRRLPIVFVRGIKRFE
jgi:hypothetical protein